MAAGRINEMIDLGTLNKYTSEKLTLTKQLKEFGYSDEEVSETINKAEKETISREGAEADE